MASLREAQQRYARHYLALAERAEPELRGAEQAAWLERLELEHDNLRAVLRWSLGSAQEPPRRGDSESATRWAQQCDEQQATGLRVASAIWRFWAVRGYLSEGRNWLEGLLAPLGAEETSGMAAVVRAKALRAASSLAYYQGDFAVAVAHGEESIALYRELGDPEGLAFALNMLGITRHALGDDERAAALLAESLTLRRGLGHQRDIAQSLTNLGMLAHEQGDDARALDLWMESLALQRQVGDQRGIALTLYNLAVLRYRAGAWEQAAALETESLALCRELGDKAGMANALIALGDVARRQNDHQQAVDRYLESLALLRIVGDTVTLSECLEGLAADALARQQEARAVWLYSAGAALRGANGAPISPHYRARYDAELAAARQALGDNAFAAAWAAGQAMTLDEAVAAARELALGEPSPV